MAKRTLDVVIASSLLVVALPVLGPLWGLVRLDGGPVFYGHVRIGRKGVPFSCYKFRSMVVDSDTVLDRLLKTDPSAAAEWAASHKLTNDPRVTRVGRFLRKTSLDEMPQLFNVIRGDMSLVGPRPVVTKELEYYGANVRYYKAVRPGITGLWQISGRSDTTYTERVMLDTDYVRKWSLWRDFIILLKTVPAVLLQRGAR
ncbi:sugar transferase [Acetobacter sp. LMG 1627]|uniref:Sugar transferase n=2 Tax=Acetobacter conturbans TaxID=1737472 RepID=A0ABX0JXH4_9PROT|nr:sugar transferase [Acetobacter conturbans]